VRAVESAGGAARLPLTEAVAVNLFKLMAYKDEYEVARLHASPEFRARIAAMFEGDYRLHFHLAPPLLAKRDAKGHLQKKEFGSWMMPVFSLLARLRWLRGTPLDIFGYTAERRQERAAIGAYREMVGGFLDDLSPERVALMLELAHLPEKVRGFGHIKQANLEAAQQQEAELLRRLREEKELSLPVRRAQ